MAYKLSYALERFAGLDWDKDIYIDEKDRKYGDISDIAPINAPDPIVYEADLVWMIVIDYSCPHPTDDYGVMSKQMLEVLLSVKYFPHQVGAGGDKRKGISYRIFIDYRVIR